MIQDFLRQTEALGNIESIAAARHTHQQTVGRAQGLGVELHAGVFHAFMFVGKGLELAVVGRHDGQDMSVVQILDHGHGESRAFGRIGPDTDFVDEDEVPVACCGQDGNHVLHMA